MSDELEDFVKNLQNEIYDEAKAVYGNVAFERWLYPLYMGVIKDPDGFASLTGSCGDTMKIFLKFENECVIDAKFQTDGCASSLVCGSYAAEMAFGKTTDELLEVTGDKILNKLGSLPKEDEHCAYLAGETLQEALNAYMIKQR